MKGNIFKYLTTRDSLHQIKAYNRGCSRTAETYGMNLFVAIVNSFYQLTIVTKTSVLDVKTVLSLPLNIQGLMITLSAFCKLFFQSR